MTVYEKQDVVVNGSLDLPVNLVDLASGLYSAVVAGNGGSVIKKIMIVK